MSLLAVPDAPEEPPFFKIVVSEPTFTPPLLGVCAAYECGQWRCDALVDHLMDWLPEFCLKPSEFASLRGSNATRLLRRSARRVYETEKFKRRGEFGELILHAIIRQRYQTIPAISKIFYKDANNDTVKGFDAVHVVVCDDGLELWLGEAKFYDEIRGAIADAVESLQEHTKADYLRREFVAIENKIDDGWPHSQDLKRLMHENTPLDEVFKALCVPVLLTYDSDITAAHSAFSAEYLSEISTEFRLYHEAFATKELPPVKIVLLLLPLATKARLIAALDQKLKTWQNI